MAKERSESKNKENAQKTLIKRYKELGFNLDNGDEASQILLDEMYSILKEQNDRVSQYSITAEDIKTSFTIDKDGNFKYSSNNLSPALQIVDKPRKEKEHNKKIEKFLSLLNEGIYESKIKIKNSNNEEFANEEALIQQLESLTSDIANIEYKRNQTDNDEEKELLSEQLERKNREEKVLKKEVHDTSIILMNNEKILDELNIIETNLIKIHKEKVGKKEIKSFRIRNH